ncbi:hypothetical protein NA56DRAFT_727883 [Hyaloscypha hepaticicola]|uniref:Uncharacterized protein n=1 Tax=Hyaloscypha hepaticicola TaxID=2082293 RepID=A0A2J6PUY2_9HELO|nr:hypothetical protein NA56DRAFT_727883 [Hyaloscypha hepaticicola]
MTIQVIHPVRSYYIKTPWTSSLARRTRNRAKAPNLGTSATKSLATVNSDTLACTRTVARIEKGALIKGRSTQPYGSRTITNVDIHTTTLLVGANVDDSGPVTLAVSAWHNPVWDNGGQPLLYCGTTYGLDAAFPTQMQSALLRLYKWTSTRWHEFLHLTSKMMPCAEATVVERVIESPSPLLRELPGIATSSSPRRRRTLPWPQDAPETARSAKRRASPGYQDAIQPLLWTTEIRRFASLVLVSA